MMMSKREEKKRGVRSEKNDWVLPPDRQKQSFKKKAKARERG